MWMADCSLDGNNGGKAAFGQFPKVSIIQSKAAICFVILLGGVNSHLNLFQPLG